MRARSEEHTNEKDMMKATRLLKEAEEEFWYHQHPQPYIFPDSPRGTSYVTHECYKVPEWCLDDWHPSEKAMYPDYFAKRKQWKKLRRESWKREVKQLQEETPPAGKEGDLPPLWWHIVTRPWEQPVERERERETSSFMLASEIRYRTYTCSNKKSVKWEKKKESLPTPTANIILNDETRWFPLKIRNKERRFPLTTLFSIILEVLAKTVR
ncbi:NADH dehydrogenase [ubiquinone] 1 beta subcomplex subunit 9-like [Pan paniscus]|nr:NADH dehydrogenase [ubiquinone] 1 beta subcomplex subunit 9-like [Pan paniscus]